MRLVVDASVAMKWFLPESLDAPARALLDLDAELMAPDLLLVEAANVAWKKSRLGELTGDEGRRIVSLLGGGIPELHPTIPCLDRAMELAELAGHPIYDCVYLALAERAEARLITADRRFHRAVRATPLAELVCWVEDV